MVWRGENVGIGNQANNPSTLLHLYSDSGTTAELRISAGTNTNSGADPQIRFTGQNNSTSEGFLMRYDNSVGDMYFDQVWTGLSDSAAAVRFRVETDGTPKESFYIRGDGGTQFQKTMRTNQQFISSIATGTAPFAVSSTTVVTNLNADLLDGYSALSLPYLGGSVNTWISDDGGQQRFYFANNSHTYFRTGNDFFFRNDSDQTFASWDEGGRTHFHEPGSDSIQSSYRMQVTGDSGLNLNASEGLSSGQKSTVLRASGDKQWIDSYGVFKRNRQTIGENITVSATDNCMTAGPITINNGVTITVSNGGSWSVV